MFSFLSIFLIVSFVLIFSLLIGATLPNSIEIKEEIAIKSGPGNIFIFFADMRTFINWNPWFSKIPDTNIIFEGEPLTVCDKVTFKRKSNSYQKSIEISHLEINKKIIYEFDFGFRNTGRMEIELIQKESDKTIIYWNFSLYLSNNPLERLYGFLARNTFKKKMKIGLKKLKEKLETS